MRMSILYMATADISCVQFIGLFSTDLDESRPEPGDCQLQWLMYGEVH
jgi:hypothetical protein